MNEWVEKFQPCKSIAPVANYYVNHYWVLMWYVVEEHRSELGRNKLSEFKFPVPGTCPFTESVTGDR
jgi:hypothetical protein